MTAHRASIRLLSVVAAFALLGAPATGFADQIPTREGNIWNWTAHQPTESQVQQEEKAAGLTPKPSQRARDAATVDRLYRQLMSQPARR